MLKKIWLLLPLLGLLLSACQTNRPPNHKPQKSTSTTKVRPTPTRAPSNEIPLKTIPSQYNELTARNCVKNNMISYLGIPAQFVKEVELTDHSNIVVLHNPYSNSEGVYIRIVKAGNTSNLELYGNNIEFVSKRWHQFLDVCK